MSSASGYLGIAQRARKTATGEIIFKKFPKNEIKLLVLAEDIGENTKNKLLNKCEYYGVPYSFMNAAEFAELMGNRKAVAILDKGLAQQLHTCLKG